MAYATAQQLARWMKETFDAEDTQRAEELLDLATGVIDAETGQSLSLSTDTIRLDGTGHDSLTLPRWPVIDVLSVVIHPRHEDDGEPVELIQGLDYDWAQHGRIERIGGGVWPAQSRAVEIEYTAGYATISRDVQKVCLRMAAAGWWNPQDMQSEQLGDRSVQWRATMEPTTAERRILARYAVVAGG